MMACVAESELSDPIRAGRDPPWAPDPPGG